MDQGKVRLIMVTSKAPSSSTELSWEVKNFDEICPEGTQEFEIKSPTFSVGADIGKKSEWYICIEGANEYVGVFLRLTESMDNDKILPIRCSYTICLGDHDDPICYFEDFDYTFTEKWGWGEDKLIKISDLYQMKKALLQDNSLQVSLKITLYDDRSGQSTVPTVLETKDPGTVV